MSFFVHSKIQDKISMVDFFPGFKNGAFQDLALEDFLLRWYEKKIGQEESGCIFAWISGWMIFESFISESDILIRLSAHIGFIPNFTDGFKFDQLTFAGALEGVVICSPVGITVLIIYSASVRVVFNNLKANIAESQSTPDSGVRAEVIMSNGILAQLTNTHVTMKFFLSIVALLTTTSFAELLPREKEWGVITADEMSKFSDVEIVEL
ncbi:hypothetical protein HJFPF1_04253 [Paramyrothecium foliicola]|nr:hypothetical protein HJFPF1_04253 [Paramyrothecium foliicola]